MFRRSAGRAFKNPYRQGGGRPPPISPIGGGGSGGISGMNVDDMASHVQRNMPFKVSENMYDRPGARYSSNPADSEKVSTVPAENKTGSGMGIKADMKDMVNPTTATKSQYAWERIYNAETVTLSELSPEYYYPPPESKESLQRRRRFQLSVAVLVSCSCVTMYAAYIVTPPQARLVGASIGNQEPTYGRQRRPDSFQRFPDQADDDQQ